MPSLTWFHRRSHFIPENNFLIRPSQQNITPPSLEVLCSFKNTWLNWNLILSREFLYAPQSTWRHHWEKYKTMVLWFFSSRIPVSAYVIDPQSLNVTQRVLLTDKITGISQKCLCTKGHMQSARCRVCGGDYFQKYPGNMLPWWNVFWMCWR